MIGIPTLAEVRAWCRVSPSSITDEALALIRESELATQARLLRVPTDPEPGPLVLTLDGLEVTLTATGGTPGALYRIAWGDTFSDELVLDDDGAGTLTHTYAEDGTYRAVLFDANMHALGTMVATVPGTGTTAPQATYPEPLAVALLRRCQRTVAAKQLPLGMVGDTAGEYGASYLRSWDPEINRLENPYRIPVIA